MTIGYAWLVLVITRGLHHTPAQLLLTDSYNGKDSRATFGLYCIIISPPKYRCYFYVYTYRHIRIRLTNKAMLEQKKVGKLKKWKHFFSKKIRFYACKIAQKSVFAGATGASQSIVRSSSQSEEIHHRCSHSPAGSWGEDKGISNAFVCIGLLGWPEAGLGSYEYKMLGIKFEGKI